MRATSMLLSLAALTACGAAPEPPLSASPDDEPVDYTRQVRSGESEGAFDLDGDGVTASLDCDDSDATIGALLWSDSLDDAGATTLDPTDQLGDDWAWDASTVYATDGGQEALLADPATWTDYVVQAGVSALGTKVGCGLDCAEVCGAYEPDDDCYTEWQAIALGVLSVESSTTGSLVISNSDATWDVCLSDWQVWDNDNNQGIFLGPATEETGEYRVPAGGSLTFYYGSWTTANDRFHRFLGEPSWWCTQESVSYAAAYTYSSTGALIPEGMAYYVLNETDTDGDGVEDHVDWTGSGGVQTQYNVWDYQANHAAFTLGKLASTAADGTLGVTLTVQNRGALEGTAEVTDTAPAHWSLVTCDVAPDSQVVNDDDTTTLTWSVALGGCTGGCATYESQAITCAYSYNLHTDLDHVELPAATITYDDGDIERSGASMAAAAFDYDWDSDGNILCAQTERWRAGILARAALDSDQGEGYHGYRCALASNGGEDCYDPGHFLQIGEFMDAPEDDIQSECEGGCVNPTFDQLARVDHDGSLDLSAGDSATLSFWVVGDQLYCEAEDASGGTLTASASDDSFSSGTTGLSTLNMYGQYDWIRVCEVTGLP
ncbi:MAG: hypothetical protein H6739_12945 [Alphaproteobacteria bacterium]|nr:hypothetical protein [Alphaproteobacteria bacterium]